jgi:drug/metabolite transporter (DMT)-like permease
MISAIFDRKLPPLPVLFVLLATLWGGSFVAIEIGLQTVPPLLFAALRYDIAAVVILAYALGFLDRLLPRRPQDFLAIGIGGVLLVAIHQALLYLGQGYVPGAVASTVISMTPILTVLVAAVTVSSQRLTALQYLGVLFGFVGVVTVIAPDRGDLLGASAIGVGLIVLSATVFAVGSVAFGTVKTDLPLASLLGWIMLLGAVLLHLGSLAVGEPTTIAWSPQLLGSLAYLSLGSSVVAYVLYFHLLGQVGPVELNLVNYAVPEAATVVGWALLGSVVRSETLLGLTIIFVGFGLLKREQLVRSMGTVRVTTSQIEGRQRDALRAVSKWF